jgi:YwiC-like protein
MAWLLPREHGAYGQLAFPLIAVMGGGAPGPPALALAIAFMAGFILHEPLLVLLGQRGQRARREQEDAAIRTAVWMGATAGLSLALAVYQMRPGARWTVLVPIAFALATVPMVVQRRQKTTTGELHVALALGSCALPAGVASGLSAQEATSCWFVLTLGFWAATLAVRATIALQRREPSATARTGAVVLAIAAPFAAMWMSSRFAVHPLLWIATLPLSAMALVFAATPPSARRLRTVGWTLVGASAATTILLIALTRA